MLLTAILIPGELEIAVDKVLSQLGKRKIPIEEIEDSILDNDWDLKAVVELLSLKYSEKKKKPKGMLHF